MRDCPACRYEVTASDRGNLIGMAEPVPSGIASPFGLAMTSEESRSLFAKTVIARVPRWTSGGSWQSHRDGFARTGSPRLRRFRRGKGLTPLDPEPKGKRLKEQSVTIILS